MNKRSFAFLCTPTVLATTAILIQNSDPRNLLLAPVGAFLCHVFFSIIPMQRDVLGRDRRDAAPIILDNLLCFVGLVVWIGSAFLGGMGYLQNTY